jgi:hypothetical protein
MVKRPSDGKLVPLDRQYDDIVVGVLGYGHDEQGNRLRQDAKQEALSSKLFGERVTVFGSPEWSEVAFILGFEGMTLGEFRSQSLEDRAKMIAGSYIKSMQRTIERYRDLMKQEKQKAKQNAAAKS